LPQNCEEEKRQGVAIGARPPGARELPFAARQPTHLGGCLGANAEPGPARRAGGRHGRGGALEHHRWTGKRRMCARAGGEGNKVGPAGSSARWYFRETVEEQGPANRMRPPGVRARVVVQREEEAKSREEEDKPPPRPQLAAPFRSAPALKQHYPLLNRLPCNRLHLAPKPREAAPPPAPQEKSTGSKATFFCRHIRHRAASSSSPFGIPCAT
jgi:hypothetical protein